MTSLETITSIEEVENMKVGEGISCHYDGYKIVTDQQEILLLIDNDQNCCEDWGYMTSEGDFSDFVGAQIISLKTVDKALKVEMVESLIDEYIDVGSCIFVNVETTKGTLQFVIYNEHNGYYCHSVIISSNQLNRKSSL